MTLAALSFTVLIGYLAYLAGHWTGFRLASGRCRFCLLKHDACGCVVITADDEDEAIGGW